MLCDSNGKATEADSMATIQKLISKCDNIGKHTCISVSGPTSDGKSYSLLAELAVRAAIAGNLSTILTDTPPAAREMVGVVTGLLSRSEQAKPIKVSLNMSGMSGQDFDAEEISQPIGSIAVSTYDCLVRNGGRCGLIPMANPLIVGRTVFCDEVGELYKKMCVLLPLATRYRLVDGTYKRIAKCPARAGNGSCKSCQVAYGKETLFSKTGQLGFYYECQERSFADWQVVPDSGGLPANIWAPETYEQLYKTLFFRPLPERRKTAIEEPLHGKGGSYPEFITHMLDYLLNPHLRMECPIIRDTGEMIVPKSITPGNKDSITFPVGVCCVPYIVGIGTLPILQLMKSKNLVLASATMAKGLTDILPTICKEQNWTCERIGVLEIPYKFCLTQLNTTRNLGHDKILKSLQSIPENVHGIVITSKKAEAETMHKLSINVYLSVALFCDGNFIIYSKDGQIKPQQHIITYAGSGLPRIENGADNMLKVRLIILDCSPLFQKMALTAKEPEDFQAAMLIELNQNILQIVRCALWSEEDRIPNETVIDDRRIVAVFHNLPDGFSPQLNDRLFFEYQGISETWVPISGKGTSTALAAAINAALVGEDIPNAVQTERIELSKKSASQLSKKQRAISKIDRDRAKRARYLARLEEKAAKARALMLDGIPKRDIHRKFNLGRLSTTDCKQFWNAVYSS